MKKARDLLQPFTILSSPWRLFFFLICHHCLMFNYFLKQLVSFVNSMDLFAVSVDKSTSISSIQIGRNHERPLWKAASMYAILTVAADLDFSFLWSSLQQFKTITRGDFRLKSWYCREDFRSWANREGRTSVHGLIQEGGLQAQELILQGGLQVMG